MATLTVDFERIARGTHFVTLATGEATSLHMLRLYMDLETVFPARRIITVGTHKHTIRIFVDF